MKTLKAIRQLVRDTLHRFVGRAFLPIYRHPYIVKCSVIRQYIDEDVNTVEMVVAANNAIQAVRRVNMAGLLLDEVYPIDQCDRTFLPNPTLHRGGTSHSETGGKADE